MKRVEVAVVTFGPVRTLVDFQTPDAFQPPRLEASGDTPMGAAIVAGLEMIRHRKTAYKANGISYYRPWVFLITDGAPTDPGTAPPRWCGPARRPRASRSSPSASTEADMDVLSGKSRFARRSSSPACASRDLFAWLSSSLSNLSRSHVSRPPDLPPAGWAQRLMSGAPWRVAMASSIGTVACRGGTAVPGCALPSRGEGRRRASPSWCWRRRTGQARRHWPSSARTSPARPSPAWSRPMSARAAASPRSSGRWSSAGSTASSIASSSMPSGPAPRCRTIRAPCWRR